MKLGKLEVLDGQGVLELGGQSPVFCAVVAWTQVVLSTEGIPMGFPTKAAAESFLASMRAMESLGSGVVNIKTKSLESLLSPPEPVAKVSLKSPSVSRSKRK